MPILRLARSARPLRLIVYRLFAKPVFAAPFVVEQRQHVQQRRLACTGRSHQGNELPALDREIDTTQDPGLAGGSLVTAFDVLEVDHDLETSN